MEKKRIHLCMCRMSGAEKRFIDEAFAEEWVVPLGPNVDGFEADLKHRIIDNDPGCSGKEIAALSAGTAAIHLALVLLGAGNGDEVMCQSFTFAASANPIVYQGAQPVFVDSEPESWNMDPALLDEAIADRVAKTGRKPKAIIAVHLYGMPARIDEICAVGEKWGIPVVEDAAEALGSVYKGHECGTFGNYGILSFNGNKMITTSGGGALICPDAAAKKRAIFYATQAREPFPYYQHEHIGFNYRLSNISAGIGRGQMTVLDEHIAHHRMLASVYQELLADIDGVTYHANPSADSDANYWLSTIEIDPETTGITPDDVREHLARLNVETRPLWKPMHLQPVYADAPAYVNGVSEHLFGRGLCLPSGPWVTPEDVRMIVGEIAYLISSQSASMT
ncbi:MAG: DegT/DnrJ/EryC1/StrS family aminotransferase [Muribaculaceae bacterium]|uniref:DegT/DnrJ/EryC1/StrS family aminotransferase n=1 Tax=Duncaniella dubosii TaxID=2518971 RepID=UPI000E923C70|nr:DegT/DnrJ/EryC1/StrS family aminotransferase [Duncaniella dubosii]MBJ2191214.1 DegT/DnrJ/EryC1/StrS family aminotransferase [Muribaculaceae bacterium]MCX4284268.1 DegT/DnrJ/EryC1/StrS family aminotransferase [Duncaniella dubosii]HBN64028.1 pyridoxal phosphate-dependent aminotransferase [Porphyromonadaceae bacterium]